MLELRNGALITACSVLRMAQWCCAASLAEAEPAIKAAENTPKVICRMVFSSLSCTAHSRLRVLED